MSSETAREIRTLLGTVPRAVSRSDPRRFRPKPPELPKTRWAYFRLTCDCFTTPETQEFYSAWKPSRGKYYCEACNDWYPRRRSVKRKVPENPPF